MVASHFCKGRVPREACQWRAQSHSRRERRGERRLVARGVAAWCMGSGRGRPRLRWVGLMQLFLTFLKLVNPFSGGKPTLHCVVVFFFFWFCFFLVPGCKEHSFCYRTKGCKGKEESVQFPKTPMSEKLVCCESSEGFAGKPGALAPVSLASVS